MKLHKFTNDCGEKFEITMVEDNIGIMRGDETGWEPYYLVHGFSPEFSIWNNVERVWLKSIFDMDPIIPAYASNTICPLCLRQSNKFNKHHVIAASEGGSDSLYNLVDICYGCHMAIENGDERDCHAGRIALTSYNFYKYGINFVLCQNEPSLRYPKGEHHIKKDKKWVWELYENFSGLIASNGRDFVEKLFEDSNTWTGISMRLTLKLEYLWFRTAYQNLLPLEYYLAMLDRFEEDTETYKLIKILNKRGKNNSYSIAERAYKRGVRAKKCNEWHIERKTGLSYRLEGNKKIYLIDDI